MCSWPSPTTKRSAEPGLLSLSAAYGLYPLAWLGPTWVDSAFLLDDPTHFQLSSTYSGHRTIYLTYTKYAVKYHHVNEPWYYEEVEFKWELAKCTRFTGSDHQRCPRFGHNIFGYCGEREVMVFWLYFTCLLIGILWLSWIENTVTTFDDKDVHTKEAIILYSKLPNADPSRVKASCVGTKW